MEVLLKCGTGKDASTKQELEVRCCSVKGKKILRSLHNGAIDLQDIWPQLSNLQWVHSSSAGVEKLLFPELIKSKVTVTNAKVYFRHS